MKKRLIALFTVVTMLVPMLTFVNAYSANETPLLYESFENGISNGWSRWNALSSDYVKEISDAYTDGKKSIHILDESGSTSVGVVSSYIDIEPNQEYTACVDTYVVSGLVYIYFKYFSETQEQITSASKQGVVGKWSVTKITAKAPQNAKYCQIVLCTVNATLGEGYYDNFRLYKGNVTPPEPSKFVNPVIKEVELKEDPTPDGTVLLSESFENGIPGTWVNKDEGMTVKETTEESSDGKISVYINDNLTTYNCGIQSPMVEIVGGQTYTMLGDIYGIEGNVKYYLKFFNASRTELTNDSVDGGMGEWGTAVLTKTAPASAVYASIWAYTVKASTGSAYVDNVRLVKGKVKVEKPEPEYLEPRQVKPVDASLVKPDGDKLSYMTYNEQGDIVGDFSYGGFYKGECELPITANLPLVKELTPTGTEDDTAMIQTAIDEVYENATDDRMKVIKLKAGTYNINKNGLRLKSGILLSGEGQGPTGTILYAKDPVKHNVVNIAGTLPAKISKDVLVTDEYIKSGSKTINVSLEDIKEFKVGDNIVLYHPSTPEWVKGMEMVDIINVYNDDTSWAPGAVDMCTERIITAINGTEITLDFGVFVPYDKAYSQSYIYKIDESDKVQNAGIENLRFVSYYNGDPTDENHANTAIAVSNAKNIFVRDVSAKHFVYALINCGQNAKQVTALNCSSLDPVSVVTGGRRYAFAAITSAQQLLYTGCYSYDGRHDFEASLPVTGPIAFVDNIVDSSNTATETHGTWSTGVLYDNIYQVSNATKGFIALANRGIYGTKTSQGWTAAGSIIWNSLSSSLIAHKPPLTYQNFVVGTWGIYEDSPAKRMKSNNILSYKNIFRSTSHFTAEESNFATKEGSPVIGDAYIENEFTPVEPRSLYKAQLAERITGSIKNARPNAPVIVYPKSEKVTDDRFVTVSGIYQLGAEKVTVYVDDIPYNAILKNKDNSFEYTLYLKKGVHKIYATQTIDGFESTKTADRFITIGEANGNPDYLQSVYSPDKTRMLINDPRPTYDEYEKINAEEFVSKITVIVNNNKLYPDIEPFETNGRVLIPLRAIFEALSIDVSYDETTSVATATGDDTTVTISENNTTAYVNGVPHTLDVPATIVNGRFVVPVRFVSECFDADVNWDGKRKIVSIKGAGIMYHPIHSIPGELPIYNLVQSGDDGAGSVINNLFDNDYTTRWGVLYNAEKPDGAFGIFDVGSIKDITGMYIAFSNGDKRVYTIDIYVSDDGENFTLVKKGHQSTGMTTELEEVPFNATGRFIKIVNKKNSVNDWLNLQELAIIGK